MGASIGLDFGTTYSVVSHIVTGNDGSSLIPESVDFGDEERSITSMETLVVRNDGEIYIGDEAVPVMRENGAEIFKGFKMLLNNSDSTVLNNRGYRGDNTPEKITTVFLRELFDKVREAVPECKEIDRVVVGVPYVWTQNGEDSRKFEVVNIVKEVTNASLVEFRSEPTLACAYFVQEINKKRDNPFEGHILVIDYGGGTLDVTLCKSDEQNGKSNIRICNSWGAGENTEGEVGSAGLAFMEKVADLLLADNGLTVDRKDKEYQSFVKGIESAIKRQSSHLKKCIEKEMRYFTPGGAKYDEKVAGICAYYKGNEYFVKYSTLTQAYDESIKLVLARILAKAKADMDEMHIPYDDYKNGTFKIATIGGFCNFALTIKQIRNDTDWLKSHGKEDSRYTELDDMIKPKNRELAIAYGAALDANDVVAIKRQFPYTLCFYGETFKTDDKGMRVKEESGQDVLIANEEEEFIMFHENEEYEPGKPVFLGIEETDNSGNTTLRKLPVSGDSIPYIRRRKNKISSPIKRPVMEMKLPSKIEDNFYIAMAMELNENLTLYIYNQVIFDSLSEEEQKKPINKALIGDPATFPNINKLLGSFYESR